MEDGVNDVRRVSVPHTHLVECITHVATLLLHIEECLHANALQVVLLFLHRVVPHPLFLNFEP